MPSVAPSDIDLKIADILATLPEERKSTILEFALFVRQQTGEPAGDAALILAKRVGFGGKGRKSA
jgi:hypothetical protein